MPSLLRDAIREVAAAVNLVVKHGGQAVTLGLGVQTDARPVNRDALVATSKPLDAEAVANYIAKYATKTLHAPGVPDTRDALARTGSAAVLIWAHTPDTADDEQLAAAGGSRPRPAVVAACGSGWDPGCLPAGVLHGPASGRRSPPSSSCPDPMSRPAAARAACVAWCRCSIVLFLGRVTQPAYGVRIDERLAA
jgi:hypothetical protein